MSKIIGVTVGTTLPKPNFKQEDPTKGDYIKNKPDFDGLKSKVEQIEVRVDTMQEKAYDDTELRGIVFENVASIDTLNDLVGNTKVETQIGDAIATLESEIDDKLSTMQSVIDSKVDAEDGKGLSTNDYTDEEQQKLRDIESGANFYEHPTHSSHDLGLYKVTVDGEGHVSDASLVEKEDIIAFVEKDDILALGIPDKDVIDEEISDLNDRIDDVESNINSTNETLNGISQEFANYKETNNEAVSTNTSGIETNKAAIEDIQGDYLKSIDKNQLQDEIDEVSEKATANEAAIEILNGEGSGSVKQSIDNAFNEFAANVTNDNIVNTYKELIDYAAKHGPEFTELVGVVDTINTHVGKVDADLSSYKTVVSDQFTEVDTTINNHVTDENNPHSVTKDQIGLDQVDNTSDMEKPISNAMQDALDEKANVEDFDNHIYNMDNPHCVTKEQLGLENVDNTSDLDKPISNNTQDALDLKADLEHDHDDLYYDKDEILGLITVDDIDDICASNQSSGEDIDFATVASKYWVEQYYQPKGNYLTKVPEGYATEAFVEKKIKNGIGNVNNLKTVKKNLTDAVNEVLDAVDDVSTASAITLTSKGASDDFANVYELKQGKNVIGNINILKDMVVKSGEIVDVDGEKNIKLVLQNVENPLYIPVGSLVDMYIAKAEAPQVQVVINSNTHEISAYIVAGSITSVELANNAVVTSKIVDKNVTKDKLSSEVQAILDKANVAEQNAKTYIDNLNEAMGVRMSAAETKLGTIEDSHVMDKAHEHANKSELDLIASGDKAKWDKVVTDLANEVVRAKAAERAHTTAITAVQTEAKNKVASVGAGDNSVTVAGTTTVPTVAVKLSQDSNNIIKLVEDGLKVVAPATAEYIIEKTAGSSDYDAVYKLMKDGAPVGASINIPKSMVVKSGSVVDGNIVLVLNDDNDTEIVIPADSLIEHLTSGSTAGDMVIINISDDYKVTATIANGSITMTKLAPDVLGCIGSAHSHDNADVLAGINAYKVATWDAVASKADTIQSASGEVIAVNNSAYTPLKGLKIFGKTEQITTIGKNLFPLHTFDPVTSNGVTVTYDNGGIRLSGSLTDTTAGGYISTWKYDDDFVIPAGTYTCHFSTLSQPQIVIRFLNVEGNTQLASVQNVTIHTHTVTLTEPAIMSWSVYRNNNYTQNIPAETIYIQIEEGSTATAYEPYTGGIPSPSPDYPQTLESVGDGGTLRVTACGKNLLKNTATTQKVNGVNFTVNEDGSVTANGTATDTIIFPLSTGNVFTAGTYILSGCPSGGNATNKYSLRWNGSEKIYDDIGTGASIVVESTEMVQFYILIRSGVNVSNLTFYPILRLASVTDATYEPYKDGGSVTVTPVDTSGNALYLPGIPVTSGGNYTDETGKQWICDEVDFEKGVYIQRVRMVSVSQTTSTSDNLMILPDTAGAKRPLSIISNYTDWAKFGLSDSGENIFIRGSANASVNKVNLTHAELNALLTETPMVLIYALAEENHIPLSEIDPDALAQYATLHTNYPNTTVYNDAGAHMGVKYYTPNTAVQMVHSPSDEGKILTIDEHGCVILKEGTQTTLSSLGVTATATELNYVDGVTSNIQTQLNNKANASHGTHVSYSTTAPVMDGTASAGSATTVARSDHKHPTDTSRASKTEFDTHTANTSKHITDTERTNWNAAKSHADSAHNYLPLAGGTLSGNTTINNAGARYRVTNGTNTTWFGMNSAGSTIGIYDETNKKYLIQHDGTNTQLNGNCTGNAGSATKVYTTATNSSTYKSYQIPFVSGGTSGNSNLLKNNGIKFDVRDGTTSQNGVALLLLGDTTVSGTDGNKSGGIYMYNSKGKYAAMIPAENTGNITITLPSATGTLATIADINALRDEFANGSW